MGIVRLLRRFIIADKVDVQSLTSAAFPNKRAVVIQHREPVTYNQSGTRLNYPVEVVLWKTISSKTLDAIFRYPLTRQPLENVTVLTSMNSITAITLHKNAYLLSSSLSLQYRFFASRGGLSRVIVHHVGADERVYASIREVIRCILLDKSHVRHRQVRVPEKKLLIRISDQAQLLFWLQEVSTSSFSKNNLTHSRMSHSSQKFCVLNLHWHYFSRSQAKWRDLTLCDMSTALLAFTNPCGRCCVRIPLIFVIHQESCSSVSETPLITGDVFTAPLSRPCQR